MCRVVFVLTDQNHHRTTERERERGRVFCANRCLVVISDLLQQPRKKKRSRSRQSALERSSLELPRGSTLRSKRLAVVVIRVANPTRHHYRAFLSAASNQQRNSNSNKAPREPRGFESAVFRSTIEDPKDTVFMNHFPLS